MKKIYEIALHAIGFRSILCPPTRTHIMTTTTQRTAQQYQAALILLQTEQASLKGNRTRQARERFRAITAEFFALKAEWKTAAEQGKCELTA